jgi:inosose dehydratase
VIDLANSPTSWGIEEPDARPPYPDVLDQIAATGYRGVELGPVGYMPEDPVVLRAEFERRRLQLVGGYVFEPLHTSDGRRKALDTARRTGQALSAAGALHFVIIPGFTPDRERAAGRADAARPLDDGEWSELIETVHDLARLASEQFGLAPVVHPHAGTHVEFLDEVERLIADTDPATVALCIDTGHCAYAGFDPVELYRRHAARVAYLHLKDVAPDALSRALSARLAFNDAVGAGVFCPLGEGTVDFAALRTALDEHGYDGWATVEQDRLPTDSSAPAEQAAASLAHLREVGFA